MNSRWRTGLSGAVAALAIAECVYLFWQNCIWALYQSLDTGWILQTGQYILSHGVPTTDHTSWTHPGCRFVVYQWLFEAMVASVFKLGSLWLVGFVSCLFSGLLYFFLLPRIWTNKGIPLFLPFVFLSFVQTPHWFNVRPQLGSYFLILLFIDILERHRVSRGRSKWIFALPPLMVLWANLHSFWSIGLLILLVYLASQAFRAKEVPRTLGLVFLLSLAAVLINPYGAGLVSYVFTFVDGSQYSQLLELGPAWVSLKVMASMIYLPVAACIFIRYRLRVPAEGLVLSLLAAIAAICMRRFESVAVIVSWPYLALSLESVDWSRFFEAVPSRGAFKYAWAALALIISGVLWFIQVPSNAAAWYVFTEDTHPLLSIVLDHRQAGDRMFNDSAIGSWLIAMGAAPVYIDTRFDMYPREFCIQAQKCIDGNDWQDILKSWRINKVVLLDESTLYHLLTASENWSLVLDDGVASWWVPSSKESAADLKAWGFTDQMLGNSRLPKRIKAMTAAGRCAKYLVEARLRLLDDQPALALESVNNGLSLMPDSRALKVERELCSRLLQSGAHL